VYDITLSKEAGGVNKQSFDFVWFGTKGRNCVETAVYGEGITDY